MTRTAARMKLAHMDADIFIFIALQLAAVAGLLGIVATLYLLRSDTPELEG